MMKKLREYHSILIQTLQSQKAGASGSGTGGTAISHDAYKRYKTLQQHEKIACLITSDDLKYIETVYAKMKTLPEESKDYSPEELA